MPKFAANISFLFQEYDALDRIDQAAATGFDGVECLFPYDIDTNLLQERLEKAEIPLVLFNMAPGHWNNGERGITGLPGREDDFQRSAALAFETAQQTGTQKLHVLAGLKPEGYSLEACLDCYCNNLLSIADQAKDLGITLTIEPINSVDMPGYLLSDCDQALDILRALNHEAIGLQFDIYHRQMTSGRILEGLEAHLPWIRHIQIASVPGRHEPGSGEVDCFKILKWLDAQGYEAFVGCEYKPFSSTEAGVNWIKQFRGAA